MRIICSLAMAAAAVAFGQTASPPPAFEVASVKLNTTGEKTGVFPSPGRIAVFNYPLKRMIAEFYRLKYYQISGADGWMNTACYDIVAKAPDKANFSEMIGMLKTLIGERFQLKFHMETKELPTYWLLPGKSPKLRRPAAGDTTQGWLRNGGHSIEGHKMPIAQLVFFLGGELNRPLLDKTGLEGDYEFKLVWSEEEHASSPADAGVELPDIEKPSLFAALQEQLGLKLELHSGPVEILVVDRAERPTLN